ncbi:MAG: hypothetical protein A2600_06360 [Candidatus Lambdaproteobacteria bacterium RIFOXYD1_FULL_56_27]|uniref:Uncharacterized protein n=1 Tax=Candidatus Lambdaproteobacteria bacterium RIFOXYD2_FULL_56_26 TaxID=1817773 RepID=A0A1F6H0H0_9PROT|nr:MAG: hypothetical protein A2426_00960 [Candidatus Lambdaproteobacteria bacterium RIFOXYC1_FULL_56_13]OGH03832.1 MAG: hypothetical protein A2557_11870 [Candidatus Lambdaproteobacteria bacterium RIFOXYD2_FULL_56_26]OGH08960.1 MAG: hypothetical protein A2600_06360 [Candidatus Lambdaproteobacteria bacterium RIFOXYD1_FULL_56_27]
MIRFLSSVRTLILIFGLLAYLPVVAHAAQGKLVYCYEQGGTVKLECLVEAIEHVLDPAERSHSQTEVRQAEAGHLDQPFSLTVLYSSTTDLKHAAPLLLIPSLKPAPLRFILTHREVLALHLSSAPILRAQRTIVLLN